MRKIISLLFIVILYSNFLIASNWVGGTGDWSVAANWNPAVVPTASDDVTIYSGVITVDVNAFAKSVTLGNANMIIDIGNELLIENASAYGLRINGASAEFTNNGTLTINTSVRNGLLNQASSGVTNNGTININGTTGFYHAIDTRADFLNSSTGEINIDNTETSSALYNLTGTQVFTNDGVINISQQSGDIGYYGIDNIAIFINTGTINIGSSIGTVGRRGINNAGTESFINNGGTINIDYTGTAGNFSAIENSSTLTQNSSGSIIIGNNNYRGIGNTGIFNNSAGSITIGLVTSSNIYNYAGGNFTNSSSIDLNGTGVANTPCIDNRFSFINGGTITMDDSQGQGINNYSGSTFTNNSNLEIGQTANISTHGIENNGAFTSSGVITIGSSSYTIGGRGIYNTNSFINSGSLSIDNTTSVGFQNNGGTVDVQSGSNFEIALIAHCSHRGIDNNGTFDNQAGSTITVKDVAFEAIYTSGGTFSNYGTYIQNPVTFYAIRGAAGSSFINKSTGEIFSGKTIDGTYFTNEGTLNPGNSPGILEIINGFAPTSTAVYNCEINGTGGANAGDQDLIKSTAFDGTTLDGTLNLDFGSFTPASDDEFTVLEFVGTLSGTFSTVSNLPTDWVIDYGVKLPGKVVIYGNTSEVPIELVYFTARTVDNDVKLTWQTASEINNDYFQIEHSVNGEEFNEIGHVDGQSKSLDLVNYNFTHNNPSSGLNYYRLKQVDIDGGFEYSKTIKLYLESKSLSVYPSPANSFIIIDEMDGINQVKVYDVNGNIFNITKKSNNKFDVSDLPNGLYFGYVNDYNVFKFVINR